MPLTRLLISDFQCHETLKVDLDEGVTVFVGRSDVGKSAVLRGLRWAFLNQPSGEGVRRFGSTKTRVGVGLDGHRLVRQRTKSENYFKLDGSRYDAVGLGKVPDPIRDVVNVDPVINFQGQLDSPFLFGLTGGGIAEQLNSIVDLSNIDRLMAWVGKKARKCKSEVGVLTEQAERLQAKVDELDWVRECKASYEDVSTLLLRRKMVSKVVDTLEGALFKARGYQEVYDRCKGPLEALQAVIGLLRQCQKARSQEMRLTNWVGTAKQTETESLMDDEVLDLQEKVGRIGSLRGWCKRLHDNIEEAKEFDTQITQLKDEIAAWVTKAGKTYPRGTDDELSSSVEGTKNGAEVGFKCPKCGWVNPSP